MKKVLVLAAAAMFALPALASAQIVGDCADCHTMHNSEQGQAVAVSFPDGFTGGAVTGHTFPIQNLLRMDCIACHAQDTTKTVTMPGGSVIPQVYHSDAAGDLAGGNFKYVAELGDRKGHNVRDLLAQDAANLNLAPGDIRNDAGGHNFENFTCAGAKGCHGTRSQSLSVIVDGATDPVTGLPVNVVIERVGISAVSGAHHNSYEGLKDPAQIPDVAGAGVHSGEELADSYRFLRGLKGWGNEAVRWENVDSTSHNEYFGVSGGIDASITGCNRCHVPDNYDGVAVQGRSSRMNENSSLRIPNQSMSGFCSTCHGNFHSSGGGPDLTTAAYGGNNGVSGAFLRHPSDYVIPNSGEYAAYQTYDISAPVARQTLAASNDVVTPGSDMVMCLSCHKAHGSEHDGMLRFDYGAMTAGFYGSIVDAQTEGGCLACHTTKGVAPANR